MDKIWGRTVVQNGRKQAKIMQQKSKEKKLMEKSTMLEVVGSNPLGN
jgi:hypothetical protein